MGKTPQVPVCAHRMSYRVCYADTDQMARVYYGHYLVWFERARTELLRAAGYPYRQMEKEGFFLPVRRCEVRYASFVEYDEEVTLATWVSRLRHATAAFTTAVLRAGVPEPLVVGTVELACVNVAGKPAPVPESIRAAVEPYVAEG